MKKIDKVDVFLFILIVLATISGSAELIVNNLLGFNVTWLKVLTAVLISIPSLSLLCRFSTDFIYTLLKNYEEKKKGKR